MLNKKLLLATLLSAVLSVPLLGQSSSFSINGIIVDSQLKRPISFAYIHVEELNRTAVSSINGEFVIKGLPSGSYTLTAHRIGYRTQSRIIELTDIDLEITIELNISVLSSEAIEVVGTNDELTGSGLDHASKKIFGSDLRRNLGSTLSETLANLPGFDQRTMGSAPGRPVIRGLGDERVVILQDGISSGDISSQSSDHAVTIDPISASEVEIARGPAALAYGANAIGGVINVVKNQIQTTLPSRLTGTFSLNGQTVNTGVSSAINMSMPVGTFAIQADINGKYALDTNTPLGKIDNTFYQNTNDAIGISWIRPWGYAGLASSVYLSDYGIPPDPNGHPNGVDIQLRKYQLDSRSEVIINKPFLKVVEIDASFKNYNHKEIEKRSNGDRGSIGTEFTLLTTNFDIRAKHGSLGFLESGSFGISSEIEDYTVFGANTPPSNNYKIGAYIIEEFDFRALHVEGGLRADFVQSTTSSRDLFYPRGVQVGSIDSTFYKDRSFGALSGSVTAIYDLGNGVSIGSTILRSFRAPTLEELYSEGPHLASYSFEVGNPDLKPERAWAKEVFAGYSTNTLNANIAFFHNSFDNYLYSRNTGRASFSRPDLQDYQFVGTEAELYGMELSGEVQVSKSIVFNASASYTIGEQDTIGVDGESAKSPLPQIPPFKATTSIKYIKDGFEVGSRVKFSAEQTRTDEFESNTDSYTLLDLFVQHRFTSKKLLHTLSLNVNNLLDETYYNHLSRIKDLRAEPGRNISLLYRVYF